MKIREFGVKVRFWTLFWQGTNVSALCISRCKRNRTMKCKGIYHTWQDLGAFIAMSSTIKSEYWLALWPKVFYKSRERIKISAFAAHHGPNPAFLTIILDKACLGSMLKGSQHSGGGQKACFQGFQKCTILAQETGPHTQSFQGNISTPLFLLWWVWFDPKPIWEQNKWWNSDRNPHFYTHATILAGERHNSSPPLSPLTPNSLISMQKCYMYV